MTDNVTQRDRPSDWAADCSEEEAKVGDGLGEGEGVGEGEGEV